MKSLSVKSKSWFKVETKVSRSKLKHKKSLILSGSSFVNTELLPSNSVCNFQIWLQFQYAYWALKKRVFMQNINDLLSWTNLHKLFVWFEIIQIIHSFAIQQNINDI